MDKNKSKRREPFKLIKSFKVPTISLFQKNKMKRTFKGRVRNERKRWGD